ncbi:hypothetical protein [Reichenbachiella ulvae]|uniref:Uncharacterized protein n=1 Tax=Reichenbachiella ulvae TaxID=2980104 RepID=A0ABT3D0N6_9BACT|nr:hypothetical protein [Reichenbachiella ulvae]MCV9389525.1 hypothetical protein [Reichenbachiella ulvae]
MGESDGVFNVSDYIEFYGQKHDGTSDTPLYLATDAQPHTYYNLFSDSSAYFLTYRLDLGFGLRMSKYSENNVGGLAAENYFIQESRAVYANYYFSGQSHGFSNDVLLGSYDYAEGWTGSMVTKGQSVTQTLTGLHSQVQLGYTLLL